MVLSKRLGLFPETSELVSEGQDLRLEIARCNLDVLADQYGTPFYVYDRQTMDNAVAAYRRALVREYPGKSSLTYAGKAFLCLALGQWAAGSDLFLDCSSAGELHIAVESGVERERILVHGVNKNNLDLDAALRQAGVLVIDNLAELKRILEAREKLPGQFLPELWLRFRPGLVVETHHHTQTGQSDSKFGMGRIEIIQAARLCREHSLPLKGLHFHLGSDIQDATPIKEAVRLVSIVMKELREEGWMPDVLCPGGGLGVAYHENQLPHPSIDDYVHLLSSAVVQYCREYNLPLPCLVLEPGRSLVARAGVAVYELGSVKYTENRRWFLLDGGLADNPRPALYQARYSALPVRGLKRTLLHPAWLAGPYCESGDVLIEDLLMPEMQPGERVAVPVSGAYQLSMGSNYNGARKPAVLWLDEGRASLIQRRETLDDLLRRDFPLP